MQLSTTLGEGLRNYWSQLSAFSSNARLFLLSNLLGGVVISIYSLLFNFYLLSLGYQQDFLGLIASLGQLTIFLAALPSGMLSNTLGRKRAMLLAVGANVLVMLGFLWHEVPETRGRSLESLEEDLLTGELYRSLPRRLPFAGVLFDRSGWR